MAKHLLINLMLLLFDLGKVAAQLFPRPTRQTRQYQIPRHHRRTTETMPVRLSMNQSHRHLQFNLPPCEQDTMTSMLHNGVVKLTTSLISHLPEERTHMHICNALVSRS
jgi:hypothetical protein